MSAERSDDAPTGGRSGDDQLRDDELAALRQSVTEAHERATSQVRALERDLAQLFDSSELSPPDDEHDPEGPTIAYERAKVTALLEQARADVDTLERSMRELEASTRPRCERCGGVIGIDRLLAMPTVRTCITCAARRG